jgi:YihY family inner membrane protein
MQEVQQQVPQFLLPVPESARDVLRRRTRHVFRYWMETEVHVYGFSIAANVLLSFFPFLIVMLSLCRAVLGRAAADTAIGMVLDDFFPGDVKQFGTLVEFLFRNLRAAVESRGSVQIFSLLLLLFTANGVFEPLEVALNKAWGITKNRSYVRNQMVSLGLIFGCGSLALLSTLLSGWNARLLGNSTVATYMEEVFFRMAAVPVSMAMLFLIYWLLPNAKISVRFALVPAVFVGVALEGLKYVNLLMWPLWRAKLEAEYGPFYRSVTIILWSFLGSMLILAGAEWAARSAEEDRARGWLRPGPIAAPES